MEEIKFEKFPSEIYDKVKTNKEEFVEKFIDELEELFPDTVKDGKVDFQALLERFGEYEDRDERYELTWVGKNKARQESFEDIVEKTLKYIEEDSKNPETTENLYIEGDNLDVLKLLRKSYYGKINMIYIDPPYNTGNDFVYKDDFIMSKVEYDKLKGDVDEYGKRLVKNSVDSGRYHSNWLNMMYPRLQVAKDLLTDDGVIFISIDDNEVDNLKKICDEIFDEDNSIRPLVIELSKTQGMKVATAQKGKIVKNKEYILIYTKNKMNYYNNSRKPLYEFISGYDTHFSYFLNDNNELETLIEKISSNKELENEIEHISKITPLNYKNLYKYMELSSKVTEFILNNSHRIFADGNASINIPNEIKSNIIDNITPVEYDNGEKKYRLIRTSGGTIRQLLPLKDTFNLSDDFNNKYGRTIIRGDIWKDYALDMMNINKEGGNIIYRNGKKPIRLIKDLMKWQNDKNSIMLDFFSGSASTAHAVMDLNAEDDGDRKFIMVQIPENLDETLEKSVGDTKKDIKNLIDTLDEIKKPHYLTEIGKERIRRSAKQVKEKHKDKEGIENVDTGFKVFRVEDTNFKRIKESENKELEAKYRSMNEKDQEDFNPHFTDLDIIYELMLRRQDIKLTEEIKKLDRIGERTFIVGDTMLVCLEENVTEEMVDKIGDIDTDLSWIVLRDSAFGDNCELKINTTKKLRSIIKSNREKNQKIYWI